MIEAHLAGSNKIGGGDFVGEVASADFISGSALAAAVGLTEGTLKDNDTPWLKFVTGGKTLYIPKKPIRMDVNRNALSAAGLITGTTTVQIQGETFKVRLMTGSTKDPDPGTSPGGEYNELFVRCTQYYTGGGARFDDFTYDDVGYAWTIGSADPNKSSICHCQEMWDTRNGLARGYSNVAGTEANASKNFLGIWYRSGTAASYNTYWRPVLELVP